MGHGVSDDEGNEVTDDGVVDLMGALEASLRPFATAKSDANDQHPTGARMTTEGRKYGKLPSVTTIINVLGKPGLPWGAAKETALYAVHHMDEWTTLPPEVAVDKLRRHHKGVWDNKRDKGSAVHEIAKAWAAGRDVDVPVELNGYVDALERFYAEWDPMWIEVERSVISETHGYAGTLDAVADLGGAVWELDFKTGADVWPEAALQLAAYRYADGMAVWSDDAKSYTLEEMVTVERCGVVHLADDGTYRLVPIEAGRREFDAFLAARALWEWNTKHAKGCLGEPVALPIEASDGE